MFEFFQNYGMGTISLVLKNNPGFLLLLSTGIGVYDENYLFELETKNCDLTLEKQKNTIFKTSGHLISKCVFEYQGKSVALIDLWK